MQKTLQTLKDLTDIMKTCSMLSTLNLTVNIT